MEDGWRVTALVPGLGSEDIDVSVAGDLLTLQGGREPEDGEDRQDLRNDPTDLKFKRSLRLGPAVDTDRITATVRHGVLTVRLPRREETQPRAIEVSES